MAPDGALASAAAAAGAGSGGQQGGAAQGGQQSGQQGGAQQAGQQQAAQQGAQQGGQQQGSGAGPSAQEGGGQAQQASGATTPYRPEGLPDHLAGASDKETLDKVWGAYKGARDSLATSGAVPKSPEEYKLEFGDKVKPYTGNFDKDPLFKETLKIAHDAGITDKQFGKFLPRLLEHMVDGGLVAQPIDAAAELMKLVPANAQGLDANGQKQAAARRLNDNIAFVDGIKAQIGANDAQGQPTPLGQAFEWLAAQTADNVHANHLVEWLRGQAQETRPAMDGGRPPGGADEASVKARMNDPRNDPRSAKYEAAFAAETDRLSKQVFG